MTLIGKSSHALFFNGVSDSVVIPNSAFANSGLASSDGYSYGPAIGESQTQSEHLRTSKITQSFTIEAWAIPDCGGVIASKEGLFELRVGGVGTPGPAQFTVHVVDDEVGHQSVSVSTASPHIVSSAHDGWDGVVYPTNADNTFHGSFNAYDSAKNTASALNHNARELLHICGIYTGEQVKLYVNGELVASEKLDRKARLAKSASNLYIGGKGGEYRGVIESVHWRRGYNESGIRPLPLLSSADTIALYRFEEPVNVPDFHVYLKNAIVAGATSLYISPEEGQQLIEYITGNTPSGSTTVNLLADPYSNGVYETPYSSTINHTPFNLIINPTGTDILTGLPYTTSPPERLRLTSIVWDGTANTQLVVQSIHLGDAGASQGTLHAHAGFDTTNNLALGSTIVLVHGDSVVDAATGKPYRAPNTGTRMVDRTGQMVVDEFDGNHGFIFNQQMATSAPYGASWSLHPKLQAGHTGRHKFSHVNGHPYLRTLPPSIEEVVNRNLDGASDTFKAYYDGSSMGLREQLPIGTVMDVHRQAYIGSALGVETSSTPSQIIENGMASLDASQRNIIAIGGSGFSPIPFLLKGHASLGEDGTSTNYDLHLTPEDEPRIAVLSVPDLATDAAPFVEIHYNAIDLTGTTMGMTGPALCVVKTVPSASAMIGGTAVADHIISAIAAGEKLHAPGGLIRISDSDLGDGAIALTPHRLVGDNAGGTAYELELDKSRIPSNYTPANSTDLPQSPPLGIKASHVSNTSHDSQYHKLIVRNAQGGTSQSASQQTADLPVETAPSAFVISPMQEASSNDDGVFDTPPTNQRTNLYEMFDIIDNWQEDTTHYIVVQPSMRNRTMQLHKFVGKDTNPTNHNYISIEYMQCRGRLKTFKDSTTSKGRRLVLEGVGLLDDIRGASVDLQGDGSPDSHPIKEITPGGPVVSVSLGGLGQGGKDTKPTYDPSPIARIGWNTRRPCGAVVDTFNQTASPATMTVIPLNNQSDALASWGHICFPPSSGDSANPSARIYLAGGASAAYYDIVSSEFKFAQTDTNAENGWYLDANGLAYASFDDWATAVGFDISTAIYTDPYIGEETTCADGTTANDRMFQKLDSVQHDYQLGTQYASTRALVEIPMFPNQFFEDRSANIFPGPDNSMKITVDTTMTAHTFAPNPVGIRLVSSRPTYDATTLGPYHYNFARASAVQGTVLVEGIIVKGSVSATFYGGSPTTKSYLIVENANIFPQGRGTTATTERRVKGTYGARKVFLSNGEYGYYHTVDYTNNQLLLVEGEWTDGFVASLEAGIGVKPSVVAPYNPYAPRIANGSHFTEIEGAEFRNDSHYDRASVQTQGGNIDYGLRQYVSAVEFKAGPQSNPHLPKLQNRTWKGTITNVSSPNATKILTTNGESFPRIGALWIWGDAGTDVFFKIQNLRSGAYYRCTPTQLVNSTGMYNLDESRDELTELRYELKLEDWSAGTALTTGAGNAVRVGDELQIVAIGEPSGDILFDGAILNANWLNPYAQGGLREGDTIWMNMHYTNPHATDGLFCKSRGVLNEFEVHRMFNGGQGAFGFKSRESIPMENFLIGNNCRETAENFAQHVNQTIIHNLAQLGDSKPGSDTRPVAFVDPYLTTDDHARVLLYDVKHDREFIAFHDIHMQVQTSPDAIQIDNMDVANGHATQIRHNRHVILETQASEQDTDIQYLTGKEAKVRSHVGRSTFIEGAYSHINFNSLNIDRNDAVDATRDVTGNWIRFNTELTNRNYNQWVKLNEDDMVLRTHDASGSETHASWHFIQGIYDEEFAKDALLAAGHYKPEWGHDAPNQTTGADKTAPRFSQTSFDTPDGTRAIPAYLCLKGIRATNNRASDSPTNYHYDLPQWAQMDFTRRLTIDLGEVGIKEGITNVEAAAKEVVRLINQAGAKQGRSNLRKPNSQFPGITIDQDDASAPHTKADYAVTGSTHDPAPFWHDEGIVSFDRGSHMGYVRAHIGRVVVDTNGNEGFSVVIHSTIPGATGRNFCVWLDNSKGQSTYSPQFLIGHGGRFTDFYCEPNQMDGENMHPAPMPINRHGRPFAPITTLHEMVSTTIPAQGIATNKRDRPIPPWFSSGENKMPQNGDGGMGASNNTVATESTMPNEKSVVQGLRKGQSAVGRINFGGFTASGIPGWSPNSGTWGFGEGGKDTRLHRIYTSAHTSIDETTEHVPIADKYNIGDSELYAVELQDHRGVKHRIRIIYKQHGEEFATERTVLPPTMENEIVIWIDDRDVGQGGFTIGRHMKGKGDIGNRVKAGAEWINPSGALVNSYETTQTLNTSLQSVNFCGNRWRTVRSPLAAYAVTLDRPSATTGTLSLHGSCSTANSFGKINKGIWHDIPDEGDALGFMGFPKTNGIIQISYPSNSQNHQLSRSGAFISYTSRTTNSADGTHKFYGCQNIPQDLVDFATSVIGPVANNDQKAPPLISPTPNWTCLLTDEVLANAVAFAINMDDPNSDNESATSFDCTEMYASDGRTFGEWGVSPNAIRVKAFKSETPVMPLRHLFTAETQKDYGMLEAHIRGDKYLLPSSEVTVGTGSDKYVDPQNFKDTHAGGANDQNGVFNELIDDGLSLPVGYIPSTVLNIFTTAVGTNTNKPSPRIVNSANIPINTNEWYQNLIGLRKRYSNGDLISPNIDNPTTRGKRPRHNDATTEKWSVKMIVGTGNLGMPQAFQFGPVGRLKTEANQVTAYHMFYNGTARGEDASYVEGHTLYTIEGHWHKLWPYAKNFTDKTTTPYGTQHAHMFSRFSDSSQVDEDESDYITTNESKGWNEFAHTGKPTGLTIVNGGSGYIASTYEVIDNDGRLIAEATVTVGGSGEITGITTVSGRRIAPLFSQATVRLVGGGSNATVSVSSVSSTNRIFVLQKHTKPEFEGIRYAGSSISSKPIVYFRGGRDSIDHSVPLYFGGGFSGAVFDINDGTQNDYTDMYTHPYSSGPTGTAGIQNANEIMGSHCILDTNAMLAMFPGTPYLDQHKGQITSPFHNKDIVLPSDMGQGTGATGTVGADTYTDGTETVAQTQPSPLVLRFAYPFARYGDNNKQTTYVIFGPGQSVPHMFQPELGDGSVEMLTQPSVALSLSAIWSERLHRELKYASTRGAVPGTPMGFLSASDMCFVGTPAYAYLPNDPSVKDNTTWHTMHTPTQTMNGFNKLAFMPPSKNFVAGNASEWNKVMNWEPAHGTPNLHAFNQEAYYGLYVNDHFLRNDWAEEYNPVRSLPHSAPAVHAHQLHSIGSTGYAHPFQPMGQAVVRDATAYTSGSSTSEGISSDSNASHTGKGGITNKDYAWHMDGGYLPGGNMMDDRVIRNPKLFGYQTCAWIQNDETATTQAVRVGDNASMYRIAAPMLQAIAGIPDSGVWDLDAMYDDYDAGNAGAVDLDVIVIDATRVQNAEELGAVISCGINEFPGHGGLKALGGTFLPSFQHAHKQDKTAWAQIPIDRTAGSSALNGRDDHLQFHLLGSTASVGTQGSAAASHEAGALNKQGMTIGVALPTNYMPYALPYVGMGRIWGSSYTAVSWMTEASMGGLYDPLLPRMANLKTYDASTRGMYFYYRGISAQDDTLTVATGANRSLYLGMNYRTGLRTVEDPTLDCAKMDVGTPRWTLPGGVYLDCAVMDLASAGEPDQDFWMYINTKTGNHRWDNGAISPDANQTIVAGYATDYKLGSDTRKLPETLASTQVHFNGLHDAVDRTRPIGSVGWAGNQYSMLNSIGAFYENTPHGNGYGMPRGLGAWHPFLRFSPYGNAMQCHDSNQNGLYAPSKSFGGAATGLTNPLPPSGDGLLNNNWIATSSSSTSASSHETYESGFPSVSNLPKGTHEGHFIVISHEGESGIIARSDILNIVGYGDRLAGIWRAQDAIIAGPPKLATSPSGFRQLEIQDDNVPNIATTWVSKNIHNTSRYTAPANAGPYVEAQVFATLPSGGRYDATPLTRNDNNAIMMQGNSCSAMTGDLFLNKDVIGTASSLHVNGDGLGYIRDPQKPSFNGQDVRPLTTWHGNGEALSGGAHNFTTNHIVWKRMDGGNLSLPAPNARGLGAVPFMHRMKTDGTVHKTGETVYGNCRFSIETTNSAMMPVIQAQELAHPSMAEAYPHEIGEVLMIPNEELQFEAITVVDDTGQVHTIEGGSPFGTIIRDFAPVSNRAIGTAPSNKGEAPNMQIQLPDPDTIPGNIIVRSGFDRVQSYQHETIGTGGMQHSGQGMDYTDYAGNSITDVFSGDDDRGVHLYPYWENYQYEHISIQNNDGSNSFLRDTIPKFPFSESATGNYESLTRNNPLKTSYELHDRVLYFHIVKNGASYSKRESVYQSDYAPDSGRNTYMIEESASGFLTSGAFNTEASTIDSISGTTLTLEANAIKYLWLDDGMDVLNDGTTRRYFVVEHPTTGKMYGGSYTGVSHATKSHSINKLTGVVLDAKWPAGTWYEGASIHPSFYTPAGSTRLFASRRMRDHAEVSGNSPDMPLIPWWKLNSGDSTEPHELIVEPKMTPMPIPRMGHHFITPTMRMLPGHLAHPVYQNIWSKGGCNSVMKSSDKDLTLSTPTMDANIFFSNLTPNYPPSDIHGGAFTLMTETKVRYDGYGVLASIGEAGTRNSNGDNLIILEANNHYSYTSHFPDPIEVGAYQIIIQPNIFSQQITGFHHNAPIGTAAHASTELNITGQQVATVIGVVNDFTTFGGMGLILADPVSADVRGCEVYLNELILDINPAPGEQFTSLPPLATFNPLGVNETTSAPFTRRSMPYNLNMFTRNTPGYTLTIPWWATPKGDEDWNEIVNHNVDDYYLYCRSTYGAISAQITLAGYPSHFYHPYSRELQSIAPMTEVIDVDSTAQTIDVQDAIFFPMGSALFNQVLVATNANGVRYTATYTGRGKRGDNSNDTMQFTGVSGATGFWNAIDDSHADYGNGVLLLADDDKPEGSALTDAKISPFTRILPQILTGSRDTNNLFLADAYLCMWHHNLGRPFTAFSEGRTTVAPTAQKPYNVMPESFEMVHYHEFAYAISSGPFALNMKWMDLDSATNAPVAPADAAETPGGISVDGTTTPYFFIGYWPGGTRYGAIASRLDMWGDIERGWNTGEPFEGECHTYRLTRASDGAYANPLTMDDDAVLRSTWTGYDDATDRGWGRSNCFGYRFSVRQPYNRPRWAIAIKSIRDAADSYSADTGHYAYFNGAYVQSENKLHTYDAQDSTKLTTTSNAQANPYVGIMERQTNASYLSGLDIKNTQVRYSDGRRMTQPFGCPVRTLRNGSTTRKMFPNDAIPKDIEDLAKAVMYYVIDWWGNTTGEDVRRFPVRSFGVRPAFDPEAWRGSVAVEAVDTQLFTVDGDPDWQTGNRNDVNNTDYDESAYKFVDFFNPTDSVRVGDRGDGRGVRYPVPFNEYIAQSVDTPFNPIGMMLSYHTSEPPFTVGLLRPKNTVIDATEPPRGISSKMDIASPDGLLKTDAMSGRDIETASGVFGMEGLSFQDPTARLSPRIGIDAFTVSEQNESDPKNYIIQATQAVSLHTDKAVGQRFVFEGAYTINMFPSVDATVTAHALSDFDMTKDADITWRTDEPSVLRFNNAHGLPSVGGNYIFEVSSVSEPFDDEGWGVDTGAGVAYVLGTHGPTPNPYQSNTVADKLDPMQGKTNNKDTTVQFLVRPVRVLDYRHMSLFRPRSYVSAGPQASTGNGHFFTATAGGRYGLFNFSTPNGRASTSNIFVSTTNPSATNAPYVATYIPDHGDSFNTNHGHGPKILGASVGTVGLTRQVGRLLISENTLQHYRSDAPRRQSETTSDDEDDSDDNTLRKVYSVDARYSQALHSLGQDGTLNQNTEYHKDETNRSNLRSVDW